MYKALVVDDEEIIRRGIAYFLRQDPEIGEIELAEDGEAALAAAEISHPQIIFVDINMPFVNGLEFISRVRKMAAGARFWEMAIIIITGYDSFAYTQEAIRLGVCDYLLKPIMEDPFYDSLERAKSSLSAAGVAKIEAEPAKQEYSNMLQSVLAYLEENYTDPDLSLAKVSQSLHVSVQHIGRLLKQETGMTFMDHLTKLRIGSAVELLKDHNAKMYEIAEKCGYSNQFYFSSAFKKALGVPPLEYRKKMV